MKWKRMGICVHVYRKKSAVFENHLRRFFEKLIVFVFGPQTCCFPVSVSHRFMAGSRSKARVLQIDQIISSYFVLAKIYQVLAKLQNHEIKCLYSCEKIFLDRELGSCLILYIYMYICTFIRSCFIWHLLSFILCTLTCMCSVTDHFVMHVLPVFFLLL